MTLADKIPNNNISIADSGHARLYIDTKKVMFKVNASISSKHVTLITKRVTDKYDSSSPSSSFLVQDVHWPLPMVSKMTG